MLRALLIYLSQADWARRFVMGFPLARRTALRFVAGEELSDALRVSRQLNNEGMLVTLDLLGEHTSDPAAAEQATQTILAVLDQLSASGLRASFSLKLTQLGLKLDEALCERNLESIVSRAQAHGLFVRIDMEDSPVIDATLRLYHAMRAKGFRNLGVVIQSYLFRSDEDVTALLKEDAPIRLVKGAYKEPPEISYASKADTDVAFDRLTALMLDASLQSGDYSNARADTWPPLAAIASHDEQRIDFAKQTARALGLPKELVEFQMLYGIRREMQQSLAAEGYPVRIYVPFGREWYPYYMRRLAERPANLWFFVSSLLRR